jgi:hypothetical protein
MKTSHSLVNVRSRTITITVMLLCRSETVQLHICSKRLLKYLLFAGLFVTETFQIYAYLCQWKKYPADTTYDVPLLTSSDNLLHHLIYYQTTAACAGWCMCLTLCIGHPRVSSWFNVTNHKWKIGTKIGCYQSVQCQTSNTAVSPCSCNYRYTAVCLPVAVTTGTLMCLPVAVTTGTLLCLSL